MALAQLVTARPSNIYQVVIKEENTYLEFEFSSDLDVMAESQLFIDSTR